MLVIRQQQMDALIKGSEDEYLDFLVAHIKGEIPEIEQKYDDSALRSMARAGIKRAESYGITGASDQTAFISIMFKVAPNFDDQLEIRAVLDDTRLKPNLRMSFLFSPAVPEEVWEKARESYDESAWNATD